MDQLGTVKGQSLFSYRIHNLRDIMEQLESPLQLTALSAVRVVRCFCLALHMTPPQSPEPANADMRITSSVSVGPAGLCKGISLVCRVVVSVSFPALKLSFL